MAIDSGIQARLGDHIAQFYERDDDLTVALGAYLTHAVREGEAVILVASEAHRRALEAHLEDRLVGIGHARASGRFVCLDAAATLEVLQLGGQLQRRAFDEVVGGLVAETAAGGRPTRICDEMASLLWMGGRPDDAVLLERWWNELLREIPFSLLCPYPVGVGRDSAQPELFEEICRTHTGVSNPVCAGVLGGGEEEVSGRFAAEPQAPGEARHLISAALERLGYDESVMHHAALVTSELASNAVRHAATSFSILMRPQGSTLRIAARDGRQRSAVERAKGFIARPSHGLGVVAALTTRWGVEDTPEGKLVWAELPA